MGKKYSVLRILKKVVRNILASKGYTIHKQNSDTPDVNSMTTGLKRIKNLGINPDLVIDIGAAQGTWTEKALGFWPNAKFELIEPLSEQENKLNELKSRSPKIDYHLAVAGESIGEASLTVSDDLDGSGVYGNEGKNTRIVPIITIDNIASEHPGNVFIKFDTHGYEQLILNGAIDTLKRTSALVVEVYGFRISPTCLLFHELSSFLEKFDFRLIDIVDIMRRPEDHAFWQCDAFFLKKDHPIFQKNSYV